MATYFPYSSIINLCSSVKQNLSRHGFFADWSCGESESASLSGYNSSEISELYY